jgi:hypothetical protein
MANTAADRRVIEPIDDRLGRACDLDPDRSAPYRPKGEEHFQPHMLQDEDRALDRVLFFSDWACRGDAGAPEELFRQAPVFCGTRSAETRRSE